jgi:hypothetical protein
MCQKATSQAGLYMEGRQPRASLFYGIRIVLLDLGLIMQKGVQQ